MNFILASGNAHKAEEFGILFKDSNVTVKAAPTKLEVVEDGTTYQENALKKAQAYYEEFKKPVLADDSGINVEALPDELGIFSARFGGEGLTDKQRAELLLEKLLDKEKREAFFTCVLCFYISPEEIYFFEGRMEGEISDSYVGDGGFGYDPVFCPKAFPNKTVAELEEWKNANSHRAKAVESAVKFFKEL
ncbi:MULTISPECIES: RdgB/HAM1 family non-canonical purine NTP pyrophosphatase [Halobacteriovorax]|uniref:dITP/XTP pyrophosphatase n=1 Tax=Halobacteriovorax vibrionivorans TaxID=2152716 RepID=A0ABY0IIT6_9BACT|nr:MULTISPECIES: RdgB/HAM1 family non-canonical purine NTP pyrophosphatase [Halobacteriovorax]RZF22874.1 RdgB/HAM1 family non-canonical purine NTP pyrophosphatase [Halobacteriovorax vibrionivorans]TGD47333.1 RdgB/HAM1 family non-canonical purine NTP pyrophosphatase [Halobacteriovorax sp. Y22]